MYPSNSYPEYGIFVYRLEKALSKLGIQFRKAIIKEKSKKIQKYLTFIKELYNLTKNADFDIIFAHYIFPTAFLSLYTKFCLKKPLVAVAHGGDIEVMPWRNKIYYYATLFTLKRCDHIVAVSEYLKETLCRKFNIPEKKVSVINCGVDTTSFYPVKEAREKLSLSPSQFIIVNTGSLIPQKGQHLLIEAVRKLKELDFKLFLIGAGKEFLRLKKLIEQKNLTEKVILTGRVSPEKLLLYLNAADLYVQPSLRESFGIAPLEAMACGTPAIAFKVGGIPEYLKDGVNGYLVSPPGDIEALAEKIKEVNSIRFTPGYTSLKEEALKTANQFSTYKQAEIFSSMFTGVISKQSD